MKEAVGTLINPDLPSDASSAIEFVLEGLHLSRKLNREVKDDRMVYK